MRLQGKTAVVTGGSQGLGRSISRRFAREGARVVTADMVPPAEREEGVVWRELDITDAGACDAFAVAVEEAFGPIEILVNNAGVTRDALTAKMTEEQWDQVLDVNLRGTFHMTRAVAPRMEARGKGAILLLTSVAGEFGNIGQANYTATKMGLVGLARTWAKEFARKGADIRVNCLSPGFMLTDPIRAMPEAWREKYVQKTLLGRLGEPEEVAAAAAFLVSDEASYITGQVLRVDGGMRL